MTFVATPFLEALAAAADSAKMAEEAFRRDAAAKTAVLERSRSFAFRKLNLMRAMAHAAGATEKSEDAVRAVEAALRDKLDWTGDSPAQKEVLERFAPVAQAIFAKADVLAALAAFEQWYETTHPGPFWALFDRYVPETPLVDF